MTFPFRPIQFAAPVAPNRARRLLLKQAVTCVFAPALALSVPAQAAPESGHQASVWRGPLPELGLLDTSGKTWQLADLQGRAVLLNFWATWCPPCRAEMPSLQIVSDLYGDEKLLVLAINFKEPASRAAKFAAANGLSFPVLLDPAGKVAAQQGVKVFPTTLALAADGRPQQRLTGEVDWTGKAAKDLIEGLLKA